MINYQLELDKITSDIVAASKPSLLLHSCCGPCSSYVLEYLSAFFDITVYYYNPCIYPEAEYYKRLENQRLLLDKTGFAKELLAAYDHNEYLAYIKGLESEPEGGRRCELCFRQRLFGCAKAAYEHGFDFFTTTLTVSPHKNSPLINKIAQEAEEAYHVRHLPSDFKKRNGYKRSVELSKKYNLYRQNYCGCEFSLNERNE